MNLYRYSKYRRGEAELKRCGLRALPMKCVKILLMLIHVLIIACVISLFSSLAPKAALFLRDLPATDSAEGLTYIFL